MANLEGLSRRRGERRKVARRAPGLRRAVQGCGAPALRDGDGVVGRSAGPLASRPRCFLSDLHALGIDLFLHQQGLDTTTPAGKAMFQMMGVFAEFERAMIRERVKSGLARAKASGKTLGRPTIERRRKRRSSRLARRQGGRRQARGPCTRSASVPFSGSRRASRLSGSRDSGERPSDVARI